MVEGQVLLSKFLFDTAIDQFNPSDPFSCGLTVSMLQDSVESLISTIVEELDGKIKNSANFFELWDSVISAKGNEKGKSLPYKSGMVKLNSARVGFKHHGNLPDSSSVEKHIRSTERFLRQASDEFLKIPFDDVSLVDLIHDNEIKELIREAENKYKEENWWDVLVACSKAEGVAMRHLNIMGSTRNRVG